MEATDTGNKDVDLKCIALGLISRGREEFSELRVGFQRYVYQWGSVTGATGICGEQGEP